MLVKSVALSVLLLLAACLFSRRDVRDTAPRTAVILDHDGGIDDLVALALLLARPDQVELIGCVVIDADCFVRDAYSVSGKLSALVHRKSLGGIRPFPIAKSTLRGVHPFPKEWRAGSKVMDDLPCVNVPQYSRDWEKDFGVEEALSGQEVLMNLVVKHPTPVTICVTGPLSNVAYALRHGGEAFAKNVAEVVIMGGAVDVEGNVFMNGTDRSAEWNIYWDAPSAKEVIESPLLTGKITLFSLDSTNEVPVSSELVQRFGALNEHLLAQFIGSSWAQCTPWEILGYGAGHYYAWDTLTAAYILNRSLANMTEVPLVVEVTRDAPNEGRTRRSATQGQMVRVARNVDVEGFNDLVLDAATFV